MVDELNEVVVPLQDIQQINPMPYPTFCNLDSGGQEPNLFFYHPDHLGSTGMVTDNNAGITQGLLYAPFGEVISDYNPSFHDTLMPNFAFNAKELDEENGMYYYSARYYAPPTFISRDPMFEKYPSISPYTYCANNPMKLVDPTGQEAEDGPIEPKKNEQYGPSNTKAIKVPYAIPNTNNTESGTKTTVTNTSSTTTNSTTNSNSSSSDIKSNLLTGGGVESVVVEKVAENSAKIGGEKAAEKTFSKVAKGAKIGGVILGGVSVGYDLYQAKNASSVEKKVEHSFDAVINSIGLIPYPGASLVPIAWGLGGKQVFNKWKNDVLIPQIEMNIIGSPASQASK